MSGLNIGNFSFEVIGAPVFAIVAGMIITALFSNLAGDESVNAGYLYIKKTLQWAVIILGFMLNIKLFFPSAEKACLLLLQQLQHHSLLHI